MGRLIWFSQILCLSFVLLQFRVQSSSPSQSSPDSPPHLCRPEERFALIDFKSTTDGLETWNKSIDCCLWEGITCDEMKGHVIGLDLSSNGIHANLTTNSSLFHLEKLQDLNLAYNNFDYSSISFGLRRLKSLTYLNLSDSGYMDGSLLFEISLLLNLVSLDLSHNYGLLLDNKKFEMLMHNLTDLRFLILDSVNMSLVVPPSWQNLTSSLEHLSLGACSLQGSLPILSTTWNLRNLFISRNNVTGEIPYSYCNLTSLSILDLTNNSLGGKIPECLGNLSDLSILDLRKNKFHGRIPNLYFNNNQLRTLNLNDNRLEGRLPSSLANCSWLIVLSLANNYLNDRFPHWLGVLPRLQVLILRSNRFHGSISNSMPTFYFPQLRIIDVSQNDFMVLLPSNYLKNLTGTRDVHGDEAKLEYMGLYHWSFSWLLVEYDYDDSIMLIMKGLKVEPKKILTTYTIIDFSSNRFHGHILEELGELNSLLLSNLSHNSLTGQIPSSLGKMAELKSLDLSSNKLQGMIPEQLTNLTFLSFLNLSHNKLKGDIPEGKQFNTFSNDSYIGNSGLCGFPLTKKCQNKEELGASPSKFDEEEDDSATLFNWKFALAGYGCGLVLGLSLGYIALTTTRKPWFVVKKVEKYQEKFVGRCTHRPQA